MLLDHYNSKSFISLTLIVKQNVFIVDSINPVATCSYPEALFRCVKKKKEKKRRMIENKKKIIFIIDV